MTADRQLQERVLTALEFDPGVNAAQIGVSAHDGVVTLRGSVTTYFQKSLAEKIASRLFGVRAVANDIEVQPDTVSHRSDSAIAEAAANALSWNSAIPTGLVKVVVRDGWVTLTGELEWQYQRFAAETAIRRLYGVKGILNSIVLKPKVSPADVQAKIEAAFKRTAGIDASRVHVETRDGSVTLTGHVRSLAERRDAEQAAWAASGVTTVDDRLVVGL